MYSRIVSCTIDPAKVNEFKTSLNNEFLPRIQAQPGFIDNIESLDPATGQFSCMTLWESAADVENYDKGLFQEVACSQTRSSNARSSHGADAAGRELLSAPCPGRQSGGVGRRD